MDNCIDMVEEKPQILIDFLSEISKFGAKRAARKSGVAYTTILNWLHYKAMPTLDNAQKVANAIGMEFLLFDKE
jgi:DNA-binding phage protein